VAAIGVSLGGATVLNAALKHPDRILRFVACDTNDIAPPGNPKAWEERISMAEKEGAKDNGHSIVGEELAEKTTRRWFVDASYDGGAKEAEARRVKKIVRTNSLAGFKTAVKALYSYDMQEAMKDAIAEGLFVVGEGDGVLPQTMSSMAERYGKTGTELAIIGHAGHLPMVEQPAKFAEVVGEFICRT
jgi:pimeloyl-ACP methyl ester carboxylesterase